MLVSSAEVALKKKSTPGVHPWMDGYIDASKP